MNDQPITEEIKEEIKLFLGDKRKLKHHDPMLGHRKSSSKMEVYSDTYVRK